MGTDEKYAIKESLSDLLAKAKEGQQLDIIRIGDEIKKEIESRGEISRKFLELVELFGDIIPEEKQRYNAAIKVLSATSGLSRQNVLESINSQIEELNILERGALSAFPGFRDELRVPESRSQEIKSEIAELRGKIVQLEKEEQEILGDMAAREREMKNVEEAVSKLFTDIRVKITGIRKKIEEFTSGKVSPQPMAPADAVEGHEHEEEKGGAEEEGTIEETSELQETEFLRKCPMCGGQIHFLIKEEMWKCYNCGHEESVKGDPEGANAVAAASEPAPSAEAATSTEPAFAPEGMLTPVAASLESSPSEKKPARKKKACPVCRRQMDWHEKEKSWLCPFCDSRRRVF